MRPFSRVSTLRQDKVAAPSQVNGLAAVPSDGMWSDMAKPLLWLPAWAIVLYAAYVNARAAVSTDYLVLGLALDLFGPVVIAAMARARAEARGGMWGLCLVIAALSVTWSLWSAMSTGAHGTFGASRTAQHAHEQQADLRSSIAAAETELAKVSSARSTIVVEAEIAAILDDPRAEGCQERNGPYTRKECPKLKPLRRELGAAKARDGIVHRLDDLKARLLAKPPVAAVEPYVEFAMLAGRRLGFELDPDSVRLARTLLFIVGLELLKTYIVAFVAWYTPRSSPAPQTPSPEAPGASPVAIRAPDGLRVPGQAIVRPDPVSWLLGAMSADGPLPDGLERRNGGIFGPCRAYGAAWGVSPATVSRWTRTWGESGRLRVEGTGKGIWIGPAGPSLRRVA